MSGSYRQVVRESHDGGRITVTTKRADFAPSDAPDQVRLIAYERGGELAELRLSLAETDELIAMLQAAKASFGGAQ